MTGQAEGLWQDPPEQPPPDWDALNRELDPLAGPPPEEQIAAAHRYITARYAPRLPPADHWPGWPGPCIRVTMRASPETIAALLGEDPPP